MTTTPLPEAPVLSPVELTARWSDLLLDPPTFSVRSLWLAWLAPDGLMLPLLLPVDGLPAEPDRRAIDGMLGLHEAVAETGGLHLATALSRPGGPAVTASDAAWAEALRTGLGERVDGSWSLHLAASGTVTPMVNPPAWAWG